MTIVSAVGRRTLIGTRHIRIKALLLGCPGGITARHTRLVRVRLLKCCPSGLSLVCLLCTVAGRRRFAVVEASPDLLVRRELRILPWRRLRPPGRRWRSGRWMPRVLILRLVLPTLRAVHVLPCREGILAFSRGIRTLCRRRLAWEIGESLSASRWSTSRSCRSLPCAWLCPARRWRVR